MESKDGFHLQSIKIQEDESLSLSMPFNFQMEEKSRKYNLRSLSCMHFEQVAAIVGVGTGDFTNEASKEKKASQCSSNNGILFSHSLDIVCDCRQHMSGEASNIFGVSDSHESFSEIAESQTAIRVSDPCEDIELLLNIRDAQPAGESGDSPVGLIKFDSGRFSNQLEKHEELDILVDNVSCISGSDSAYLTIAGTHFDRADDNHHDVQTFIENPPQEGVVYPNFDCTISPKGEPFECSGEQVESSPARVAISGISQIDGVYNYPTFRIDDPHLNCEDSAVETENHLYCKKHLQKSPAVNVIENTSMHGQSLPVGLMGMSDLMEDEVRVCDICGDAGREELLAICGKCPDGAEHIYCMRIKLDKVPEGDWTCEECILKTDTEKPVQDKIEETARISIGCLECQKSGSSVNIESRSSSRFKSRSSCDGRTGANGVSSTVLLSAKRQGTPLKAQSAKKARTIGMSAVLPRSSKPCINSLLHRDTSFKNIKTGEMEATKDITSELQSSCNAQEKGKVPGGCGDKRHAGTLEAELDKKRRDLETKVISPKASNTIKNSLLHMDTSFKKSKKGEVKASKEITSVLQISCNDQEKAKVPGACGDKRHVETLKAELDKKRRDFETKVISPKASNIINNSPLHRDTSFKNLKKEEMKASKEVTSMLQISYNAQEKVKAPNTCDDKRHVETLEAELDKRRDLEAKVISPTLKAELDKRWDLETKVISPELSNTFNNSLLSREPPFKNLEKAKIEAACSVFSLKQSSYCTQEKAELPSFLGDKSPKLCSQPEISWDKCSLLKSRSSNAADLELKGQLAKGSPLKSRSFNAADLKLKGQLATGGFLQKQTVARNSDFQDNEKQADPRALSKSLSYNSVSSDKLNANGSEVLLANADHVVEASKKLNHAKETKTVKGKNMSELHNTAMSSPASDFGVTTLKSKRETMSCDDTFISESNCHNLDSVQSCGLSNYSSKPSNVVTYKPASDEGSCQRNLPQFEAAFFSQGFVIPKPDYIWLGRFQLHSNEGLASSCDGIQAHLSTFASPKVLEVADKLPEIIILEELPRLRTWPSQFIEHQATEENIALYFFATDLDSYRTYYRRLLECMTQNDLALRGNLDGVELLIFPSNLLPEKSQRWNKLLFLWGVFRGRKVDNSANIPLSNSQKDKSSDGEKGRALDLNAYPQGWEDTEGDDEGGKCWVVNNSLGDIHKFDGTGTRSSGDGVLLGGDAYSSGFTDPGQALDRGENKSQVVDLDLSLWPKSATQEGGLWLSTGIADNRTIEEMHGKPWMEVGEASVSGSHEQNLETEKETKQLLLEWQAADSLLSLSKGFRQT